MINEYQTSTLKPQMQQFFINIGCLHTHKSTTNKLDDDIAVTETLLKNAKTAYRTQYARLRSLYRKNVARLNVRITKKP